MLNIQEPDAAADYFHQFGASIVALKQGIQGAWVSQEGQLTHIPAQVLGQPVDTTGAGDTFAGGFLHGLLTGRTPEEAGQIGAVCAGLKVLGRGAIAGMPDAERMKDYLSF